MRRAVLAGLLFLLPVSLLSTTSAVMAAGQFPAAMKLIMKGTTPSNRPVDVVYDLGGLRQTGEDGSYTGSITLTNRGGAICGVKPPVKIVPRGDALLVAFDRTGPPQWCAPVLLQLQKGSAHLYEGVHPDAPDVHVYLDGA
jgi:hypothetical protein